MAGASQPQALSPPQNALTPETLPTQLQADAAAAPMAPGMGGGIQMDDWDDDEPPTNIYSKETAAEMAQAALSGAARADDMLSSPAIQAPEFEDESKVISSVPSPLSKSMPLIFIGVGAAVVVLAIVIVVMLVFGRESLGTLQLDIQPSDDLKVVIDGSKTLPGNRSPFIVDLKPGNHVITIERNGYNASQVEIPMDKGQNVNRTVTLERKATGFFLETDPPGASVWINDRPLDEKTPFTKSDLDPGTYVVRIAKGEKYAPKTIEIVVEEGQITELPKKVLDLKAVELTFKTNPPGAKATLIQGDDRQEIGLTPITKVIDTTKEYQVKYSKDGYTDVVKAVEYPPGQDKIVLATVTLWQQQKPTGYKPPKHEGGGGGGGAAVISDTGGGGGGMGTLSVQTRPWSKVYINGQFIKNTPLVNYKLKPGSYQVTLENPTYNIKKSYSVKIRAGKTTTLVKTLI
jgi:hypothetical protein